MIRDRGGGRSVSTSETKEPAARSGRSWNRGIMRFLIGGVTLGPFFVSDVDISAAPVPFGRVLSALRGGARQQ